MASREQQASQAGCPTSHVDFEIAGQPPKFDAFPQSYSFVVAAGSRSQTFPESLGGSGLILCVHGVFPIGKSTAWAIIQTLSQLQSFSAAAIVV